jgi:DNA-binding CsgD family transcriptional regulator
MAQTNGLASEFHELARANLGADEFAAQVNQALRRRLAFDLFGLVTIDPATLLTTHKVLDGPVPRELEKRARTTVEQGGCLGETLEKEPLASRLSSDSPRLLERNLRLRQLLRPFGIGDEVKLVLSVDGRIWGALKLCRREGEPEFEEAELAILAQASASLAVGLRRTFLIRPTRDQTPLESPAVIVLSVEGEIVSCTDSARELLADMADERELGAEQLPMVVYAAALRARQPNGRAARARVRMQDGRWITVRAALLDGEGRVAVVMEPSPPTEVAALMLDAYGLTPRESQIAQHAIHAFSTEAVADALGISPYTVQDHLKSIFDKMGLSSRRELAARLFLVHYGNGDSSLA